MSKQTYSTIDRLNDQARAGLQDAQAGGGMLTAVVILSGILSAIFFWQQSAPVFSGIWRPAALALGLLVGLIPSEGMFFGWKRVRTVKRNMTARQLQATTWGIVTAVLTSIFSTFALFVSSFEYVPAEIASYTVWIVFLALSVPVVLQLALYAYFAVNDRAVTENYQRAELSAMGFDAYLKAERARIAAVIDGMERRLNETVENYGMETGATEADRILGDGARQLANIRQDAPSTLQDAPQAATAVNGAYQHPLSGNGRQK